MTDHERLQLEAVESRAQYGGSVNAARTITRQIETVLAGDREAHQTIERGGVDMRILDAEAVLAEIERLFDTNACTALWSLKNTIDEGRFDVNSRAELQEEDPTP